MIRIKINAAMQHDSAISNSNDMYEKITIIRKIIALIINFNVVAKALTINIAIKSFLKFYS